MKIEASPVSETTSRSLHQRRYILSHAEVDLFPAEDNRRGIEFLDAPQNALLQFIDRFDSDVAQESAGHLGEGAFDQIKPGAMLGCVNVLEAPGARGEIGHGLPGDVGRMVVQHHADDGLARIVLVQALEQRDELHTAVALLDVGEDLTRVQVDSGEDRYSAPTDILTVAPYG